MKVALAQIDATVGDIDGNAERIIQLIDDASAHRAELIVFPELALFGYPPKDLVHRRDLIDRNTAALRRVAQRCTAIACVVGYVQPDETGCGKGLFNAAAVCRNGAVEASYQKMLLPTYDVFDETRYFNAGKNPLVVPVNSGSSRRLVGITICEDLFNDRQFDGRSVYGCDPVRLAVDAGAELLINISGSPFVAGKQLDREAIFAEQAKAHGVPLVYVNQVAGNDDLIFDGASLVFDARGHVVARAEAFAEQLLIVDLDRPTEDVVASYPDRIASIRRALVLGIRDYMSKCGFDRAVIGLSGGIDSAVTAALAVEAIGADCVTGVAMPSRFSSDHSLEDARQLADHLGMPFRTISIEGAHHAMDLALAGEFQGCEVNVAEENVQARIRGNLLMALSNKFGWLLLSTGNKSELAVGYCTLYGDMCGGLAVLSDVPKTVVYQLAEQINATSDDPRIPRRSIEKPPSAELRPNQLDSDSLPAYELLDRILELYIEREESVGAIVKHGIERSVVERVARLVDSNEYKRRQAPVGIKVTSRAFGSGRRVPIAARHR